MWQNHNYLCDTAYENVNAKNIQLSKRKLNVDLKLVEHCYDAVLESYTKKSF